MTNIFIRNLDAGATGEQLPAAFPAYAIRSLHGSMLNGCSLRVNEGQQHE